MQASTLDDPTDSKYDNVDTTDGGPAKLETKKCVVQTWREIRPSLRPIEIMMSSRVKTKIIKHGEQTSYLGGASMGDEVSLFSWEELQCLVRGGLPKDLRAEAWQAFVGVKTRRIEKYYQDLLDQDDIENNIPIDVKKQIEKDVPQTFPGHPAMDENGRNSLRRLLLAYALHKPSVGYCQGINLFAGLLLALMPEENAFWTLVGILDDYFDGYYNKDMIESQVDQLVFEELLRERFPKLVKHLDYLGLQVASITGPWFFSIFINILPWQSVFRVWDVLLFEGNRVMLFRTTLTLMGLYGPALFTIKDVEGAISKIQSLAGSTFNCNQLVSIACMEYLNVTEVRLVELREKLRPTVLASKLDPRSLIQSNKTAEIEPLRDIGEQACHLGLIEILKTKPKEERTEVIRLTDQERRAKAKVKILQELNRNLIERCDALEAQFKKIQENRLQLNDEIQQLELRVDELEQKKKKL